MAHCLTTDLVLLTRTYKAIALQQLTSLKVLIVCNPVSADINLEPFHTLLVLKKFR